MEQIRRFADEETMKQFLNEPPKFQKPGVFHAFKFLSARYENTPSIPEQVEVMVAWAEKEYWDAISYFSHLGNVRNVQFLNENVSPEILLSSMSVFDDIVNYFTENPPAWKILSRKTKVFLTNSRKYRTYSNQRIAEI
jgi:hypothetical protein